MRLLSTFDDDTGTRRQTALFGSGLIGTAIEDALKRRGPWQIQHRPTHWTEIRRRKADLKVLIDDLESSLRIGRSRRCDIVWAAGVNGFGARSEQMAVETEIVAELCQSAEVLSARDVDCTIVFHLVSSAGGLFEGQRHVGRTTPPAPIRPYGVGKLSQERLVQSLPHRVITRIYRPASVYGFQQGARRGLFAALIDNALANRPTQISGSERTLRDYVFVRDVAEFIADQVFGPDEDNSIDILGSGKPTSMFEVIGMIERLLGRPVYRRFESHASNALDLSFGPSALPPAGWAPTSLPVGLAAVHARVHAAIIQRPAVARRGTGAP